MHVAGKTLEKCTKRFSSPEHEVLMVSYCGQWLPGESLGNSC